ncbi:MAG: O-methyltransferase [Cytophagales bacterium]|nr:O-methyltransferase [Cytophagales bacterium]
MEFLEENLERYIASHSEAETELLAKVNRDTHVDVMNPRMLSGHLQGRVLSMLSHMISPQHILEIGTFTGYSALCLAEGLQENGSLDTIDINEELEERVATTIESSDFADKIHQHIGQALNIIPHLNKIYDLVFIDADKDNYQNYYDLVFDKVNKGGYIIADNVLWSGKVVNAKKIDKKTKAIMDFNDFVHQDERVQNVLFPIRDGLMILRKK